jgi:prepilin-type N-terminal cleavage/methylation domain-containing protein
MMMTEKNDKGFSLVELIVVIAIMAVLAGVVTMSASVLNGKQAKGCRDELASKIASVRTTTMGKKEVIATLKYDSGKGYVLDVSGTVDGTTYTSNEYTLGAKRCKIYYTMDDTAYSDSLSGLTEVTATGVNIEFDRASGAMKLNYGSGSQCVKHIYVVQGGKVYGIRLYQETGKLELE